MDRCLSTDQLEYLAAGQLHGAAQQAAEAHLRDCRACREAHDRLAQRTECGPVIEGASARKTEESSVAASATLAPSRPSPAELCPAIAGYELLGVLGFGGMGMVYKARQRSLNRIVALKMIRAGVHATPSDQSRFRIEAEAIARLQHPNIVQVFEVGQEAGCPYLALEFVNGTSLDKKLAGIPQPSGPAAQLVESLARAIYAAHQQGIVHRDLKPANVLLAPFDASASGVARHSAEPTADQLYGVPKISDFGLAKQLDRDGGETQTGEVIGTPMYMAPEQAAGDLARIGPAADIYALGVILYEMLTGRPPFRAAAALDTLRQVQFDEPVAPRALEPKVPRDLEIICLKCLEKDPRRRYATALDLAEDLHRHLLGEPIQARPCGRGERLWRWCVRNPLAATLLLGITLASALGFGYLFYMSGELVRSTALDSAAQQSETLGEVNDFYSDVIKRMRPVKEGGPEITHHYAEHPGTLPIPATFTIDLGHRLTEKGGRGVQFRLYSDHPFRSRKDGGAQDDFEREALRRLRQNADEPVYRFEDFQGRPVLRYATARKMNAACVACHNKHPESVKKDWKVGDVRGVLEIIRPLDRDMARARAGLQGAFILLSGTFLSLTALIGLVLLIGKRPRR